MGISVNITTESWSVDSKEWLATRKGFDTCRSVTLDLSLFTSGDGCGADDYIPSGTVIGLVTASGLYGPYNPTATDGTETAAGHIFEAARITDSDKNAFTRAVVPMLWEGVVIASKLLVFSGAKGEIDTAGKADLTHVRYE